VKRLYEPTGATQDNAGSRRCDAVRDAAVCPGGHVCCQPGAQEVLVCLKEGRMQHRTSPTLLPFCTVERSSPWWESAPHHRRGACSCCCMYGRQPYVLCRGVANNRRPHLRPAASNASRVPSGTRPPRVCNTINLSSDHARVPLLVGGAESLWLRLDCSF
jgi:hypothetical protein